MGFFETVTTPGEGLPPPPISPEAVQQQQAPPPITAYPVAESGPFAINNPEVPDPLPPAPAPRKDPPSVRDDIPIPDLKLLRRIGSGSYGEVWIAKTITGALRAVKVVWREDFEFEKTFQREFEGIKQFEPISRGHRGLMNILHVGSNQKSSFYYCVMELADDSVNGQNIEVNSYVPRTLTTDFKRLGRLSLSVCKETGIYLADALGYMHSYGLTHRDIKPSNIIFVDGMCKLADIGLVAAHGERTFVGTEGFVPPEGPGTFAADIYSLGKVLYEISSGKDRMEFPEVPDDLDHSELKLWREWNRVICQACAPNVKDRFASAADFADALRKVGQPRPIPLGTRLFRSAWTLVVGSILVGSSLVMAKYSREWVYTAPAPVPRKLTADEIARAKLPASGQMWLNSFDSKFVWKDNRHISDRPVSLAHFSHFLDDTTQPFEGEVVPMPGKNSKDYAVVIPKADAEAYCAWLTDQDRLTGALNGDFEYRWRPDQSLKRNPGERKDWTAFNLEVTKLSFGQVLIQSNPARAEVLQNGESLGHTPLTLSRAKLGDVEFVVSLPGYKREVLKGNVQQGKKLVFNPKLRPTDAVAFGRRWKNSLGMDFEPVGPVLIATNEIRRTDYNVYQKAVGDKSTQAQPEVPVPSQPPANINNNPTAVPATPQPPPPTKQPPQADKNWVQEILVTYPVTNVSRQDAIAFCQWLTQTERSRGLLEEDQSYRLPTDEEWSKTANLPRERGESPADRNQRIEGIYPWGYLWPPSPPTVNLWDEDAAASANKKDGIKGYKDGFPKLAPVGTFSPNLSALRDLGGNVWEWVQEDFGGTDDKTKAQGVVRGGSWRTASREELLSSHRRPVPPATRADDIGFRVVLSTDGVTARENDEP